MKNSKEENENGDLLRLRPAAKDEECTTADGYNSNARHYLKKAKKVHSSSNPTNDQQMVKSLP